MAAPGASYAIYLLSLADFLKLFYATRPFYIACVCASFLQTDEGEQLRRAGHQIRHNVGRASMHLLPYLVEMSSSAQMLCCIAAQERAEKTGEGCNML
jgi:hypothetical protein